MTFRVERGDTCDDAWLDVFAASAIRSFEDLWNRDEPWVDEPNRGRGGWSGVRRLELDAPDAIVAGDIRLVAEMLTPLKENRLNWLFPDSRKWETEEITKLMEGA